jgi:hypothetical protein
VWDRAQRFQIYSFFGFLRKENEYQLFEGGTGFVPPDAIRYFFYHNVISHSGVPGSVATSKAWSTAYIDATLIV